MKSILYLSVLFLIIVTGCNYDNPASPVGTTNTEAITDNAPIYEVFDRSLVKSNGTVIGIVSYWNDTVNVYFDFKAKYNFRFVNIRLAAYINGSYFPLTNGCLNQSAFPFKVLNLPNPTRNYRFTIPCAILPVNSMVYVAAYVDFESTNATNPECQNAWAIGKKLPTCQSGAGMIFSYFVIDYNKR